MTIKINFNKLKKKSWSKQETKNVQLVIDFMQQLMNNHDFESVHKKFNNNLYRQHNRSIPDGIDGLIAYIKDITKQFPNYAYDVKHIYADGDFVTFHSQIITSKKDQGNDKRGFNVHDTWRIKDNQIVEHWDSLQPMNGFLRLFFWIIGGRTKNNNGVY